MADHKEKALLADTLRQSLEAHQAAAAQLQAAAQEEAQRLAEELQEVGGRQGAGAEAAQGLVLGLRWCTPSA